MCTRLVKYFLVSFVAVSSVLLSAEVLGAKPMPGGQIPNQDAQQGANLERAYMQGDIDVYVNGPEGTPLQGPAVVTLARQNGEFVDQKSVKNGYVRFSGVPPRDYKIQIVAPKYDSVLKEIEVKERSLAKVTFDLKPMSDVEDAASSAGIFALPPRVQKDVGKALEELRADKLNDARKHLDSASKAVPPNAEIEYLYGLWASKSKNPAQATAYWMKTLELNPRHLNALISVSNDLLQQKKAAEATPYLKRAVEAEPSSWRAQALLAEAYLLQGMNDDAYKHAERANQLGHERAASVQLIQVRVLAQRGDRAQALTILEAYVKAHPSDAAAKKDLDILRAPQMANATSDSDAAANDMASVMAAATALPAAVNWLPPDVDEKVPPVEAGASCSVDDVVHNAGNQLLQLIADVDRFAATESLVHESISRAGLPSAPEKRKFDYVVSIQEVQHGFLNVEEYRSNGAGQPADFPDGVATNGLPALVLIFHPYNAKNFEMTCEGLARWNGGLAWQVHFKQRSDKPNTIKRYRIGADGPSYPVALKGRAWISSDTYQIVRLETDLVAPIPQIRLVADHAAIEYGPVKFDKGDVKMWLPQSADVYFDWKGHRVHRRHSFSKYMLFAVDDKQKISAPKVDDAPAAAPAPGDPPKEKP
jgi:tetratricopeptide (TPR) repeat protein